MAITLSFQTDSPRGPVDLTADLSGLQHYEITDEIKKFFGAALALRCCIREQEEEIRKIKDNIPATHTEQYHPVEPDEIIVIS